MNGQKKIMVLCFCTLLLATLCPVVQSKRGGGVGGFIKGRGKGSKKEGSDGRGNTPALQPTKKSLFSPKQGLKLAGAAAAGALGGYGLGSWGRPKFGVGHHGSGGKNDYKRDGQRGKNSFMVKSSAPTARGDSLFWTVGSVMVYLSVAWNRGL
ncbi:unnamed protein product [Lota lota]